MELRKAVLALLLLGMVLGLGIGVLIGWGIWPVQFYDTDPVDLRAEHKREYIVLVSASYASTGDLDRARARLAKLVEEDIAQVVADLAQEYVERGEESVVTRNLVMLADALGSSTELMLAFVATATPTFTCTPTSTPTETATATATETPTPSPTSTATASSTPRPPTATSTIASPTKSPPPSITATATAKPASACPPRPEPVILDVAGQPRDWAWVQENFNLTREQLISRTASCPGGTVYAVVELREYHDVSLRVTVVGRNGAPKIGVPVGFFGFPGDVGTPGECRNTATIVNTNQDGEASYVMGRGSSYYPDLGQIGYHAMWIRDSISGDCVQNVGMVIRNNHSHLTVTFREI